MKHLIMPTVFLAVSCTLGSHDDRRHRVQKYTAEDFKRFGYDDRISSDLKMADEKSGEPTSLCFSFELESHDFVLTNSRFMPNSELSMKRCKDPLAMELHSQIRMQQLQGTCLASRQIALDHAPYGFGSMLNSYVKVLVWRFIFPNLFAAIMLPLPVRSLSSSRSSTTRRSGAPRSGSSGTGWASGTGPAARPTRSRASSSPGPTARPHQVPHNGFDVRLLEGVYETSDALKPRY